MRRRLDLIAVSTGAAYVLLLGWAMATVSYDVWGALVMVPIIVVITMPLVRRTFRGDLQHLYTLAVAGLVAKLGGAFLRYWVAFDAYGGSADSAKYHINGKELAGEIWRGTASWTMVVPRGTGTEFVNRLTGSVYTLAGSSRLAGFVIFSWMAYWGAVWLVRAAVLAVPGLAQRRYAALVFLAPSMIYWPSAIGKEAVTLLGIGVATYGAALMSVGARRWTGLLAAALGAGIAALARPHVAAIWIAATVVALVAGLITGAGGRGMRSRLPSGMLVMAALAGFFVVASFAVSFLDPGGDDDNLGVGDRLTNIFDEASRRTEQGGSAFTPLEIDGPQDWPVAIGRTLTRPFVWEARSLAELIPAVEMLGLVLLGVVGWRRLANLPRLLLVCPFLVFAVATLLMFGLAFTPIGNLGILTRQRSLVMPLLLLLVCVPPKVTRAAPVAPMPDRRLGALESTR